MQKHLLKLIIITCLLILVAGSLLHIFAGYSHGDMSGHAWGSDDAYISYRYAQNLVEGHGLVYNPGERVEGYSNLLYTLMIALIFAFAGGQSIYIFSVILNLLLTVIAFLIFCRYIQKHFGETAGMIAAILFALCLPIWAAVASGMENTLVLLIQIVIFTTLERYMIGETRKDLILLSGFCVISLMARADGFIFPALVILYLLLKGKKRAAIKIGLTLFIIAVGYSIWRYSYYGDLLPNTFYAKVSGSLSERLIFAARMLMRMSFRSGFLGWISIPLILIIKWIFGFRWQKMRFSIGSETILAVGILLYWLYIGGDIYDERFLLILVPLGISSLIKNIKPVMFGHKAIIVIIALMALFQLIPFAADRRFRYSFRKYDSLVTLGKFMRENYSGKILATMAAGKVPYFSGLKTIDMLGLTDYHIAHQQAAAAFLPGHNKYDNNYILSRKPDLIFSAIYTNFNLFGGFSANMYNKAGYQLKYLLNMGKEPQKSNIRDTNGLSQDSLKYLIDQGYEFAVLEKGTGI
jgi:arabinofuranosyltransferase